MSEELRMELVRNHPRKGELVLFHTASDRLLTMMLVRLRNASSDGSTFSVRRHLPNY